MNDKESVEKEPMDELAAQETENAPETEQGEQQPVNVIEEAEAANSETADTEVVIETPIEVIARLEADLAEVRAKADSYMDQMQRAAAEFQNARRRQERQVQESIDRATESLVRRLLPVLDDFELALNNVPQTLTSEETAWVDGFQRIQQKLTALLADEGITQIMPDGEFDPNRHEAITHEPSDSVESGHIIATLRNGYVYKDRVLRPALVRVAQ